MPNPITLNRAELARLHRFLKIDPETNCWLWMGAKTSNGYAKWNSTSGRSVRAAHRIVYEHYKQKKIGEGLQLDHLCRIRHCVNPDHFEEVTPSENTMRQNHFERNKTHCPQNHEYNEENTRITGQNKRICRVCDRERRRVSKDVPGTESDGPEKPTKSSEPSLTPQDG